MTGTLTTSPQQTRALGAAIAQLLGAGDVVLLVGSLGAGKTELAKGIAEGLGVDEPVVSPTFTLARVYEGRLRLVHADLYRLDEGDDIADLGLDDLDDAVAVVEWGERAPALAEDAVEISLDLTDDPDERRIAFRATGPSWPARLPALAALVLILGIDTATAEVGVAIGDAGAVRGAVSLLGGRRHAEQLAPAIETLCAWTGTELGALSAIAVGTGPGLFTGLRVGVTTAKVMAQALRVPVVAVPSLDLVAWPLRHTRRRIVAVIDARRREVFHASYRPVPGGVQRVGDYAVATPGELVAELQATGEEVLLAGDGVAADQDELGRLDGAAAAGPEFAFPSTTALLELATARVEREEFDQPRDVRPLYLREADVTIAPSEMPA